MIAHAHQMPSETLPPLRRKPRRVVTLLGNKLVGLDSILPVAMQLKDESPDLSISFLFLNAKALPIVERNYVLFRAMNRTGAIAILSNGEGTLGSKVGAALRLVMWFWQLVTNRSLLLSPSDLGYFPLSVLAFAARLGGGGACTYCKPAFPANPALNFAHRLKTADRDMRWRDSGDAFLIYHPRQASDYAGYSSAPALLIGTPRDYSAWRNFLTEVRSDTGIQDEQGRDLTKLRSPVIALFYPGPAVIPSQTDNVRDTFLNMLHALTLYAPEASIVIKPHPICDLELLRSDIAQFPSLDVRVTHAHPQLLLGLATAAISTNGSNVMFDCYLEGVPVIETARYRQEILALGDTLYPNRGRIDCSDPSKWKDTLRRVVEAPNSLPKPDRSELSWPRPQYLGAYLWRQ